MRAKKCPGERAKGSHWVDGFWDAPPIHLSNSACPFWISYDGKALHPTVAWLPRGAASGAGAGAGAWPTSQGQAPHPAPPHRPTVLRMCWPGSNPVCNPLVKVSVAERSSHALSTKRRTQTQGRRCVPEPKVARQIPGEQKT